MGKLLFRSMAISLATFALAPQAAHAQAWVSDRGSLGLDLDYNFFTSSKVVTDTTFSFPNAGTTGHQLTLGAEYTPIDKLAVSASLPMVALKYTGMSYPHEPTGGSYDDGDYHSTLTDLRFGARYQILDEPLAIAPTLAFTIPLADYETIGNTVAGRGLKMAHLGLSAGYLIGIANYVHFAYEFTLAEKYDRVAETEAYSQNRSDLSFLAGRKMLDYRLDLHLGANFRKNHDGVNFSEIDMPGVLPDNAVMYHDAILAEQVFLVGAGVGYAISDTLSANLDVRIFIPALSQNTLNASIVAVGLSWSPQLGGSDASAAISADTDTEQ